MEQERAPGDGPATSPAFDAAETFSPGEVVNGQYAIVARRSEGRTGALYRAQDVKTLSEVTLKLLHGVAEPDRNLLTRVKEELSLTRTLARPAIAKVYGCDRTSDGRTFVVLESRARIEALARGVYAPGNVLGAGLVVAVVVKGKGPVSFDAGRAAQNMLLTAWNEGVASCPNGIADREVVSAALALSDDESPAIVLTFGRPQRPRDPESRRAEDWSARANRRPLEDVVRRLG